MAKKQIDFTLRENLVLGEKYLLKSFINAGSFGQVWKAINLEKDREVAIKVPHNQERGDATLSEGKMLEGIEHPNLITIYWMGRVDGIFVIEMEYFQSRTLADQLGPKGFNSPKTFKEIKHIVVNILDAIDFIHSHKICHGDLKPQNILIQDNEVKITDFGTSKFIEDLFVETNDVNGTWAYVAPEVAGSNKRYLNSDIYSIGVILYQLFTGRTPHQTSLQVINNYYYPSPREINPNIPDTLNELIVKCLKRNPDDRYTSVPDLKRDFLKAWAEWSDPIIIQSSTTVSKKETSWIEEITAAIEKKDFDAAQIILKQEMEKSVTPDLLYYSALVDHLRGFFSLSLSTIDSININEVEETRRPAFGEMILNLKGKVLSEVKNYEEAVKCFKKLADFNPKSIDYRFKYANILALIQCEPKAIEILEQINTETPGILSVVKKIAQAYDQVKDFKKSLAYYSYAYKLNPNDARVGHRIEVLRRYS
jgi:serine/threonine protein kinase